MTAGGPNRSRELEHFVISLAFVLLPLRKQRPRVGEKGDGHLGFFPGGRGV